MLFNPRPVADPFQGYADFADAASGDSVLRLLRNLRPDVSAADAAFAASRLKGGEFYEVLRFCVVCEETEKRRHGHSETFHQSQGESPKHGNSPID